MKNYKEKAYFSQNLMGPNSMTLLEEAMRNLNFCSEGRILDLGCGTGLTSMYLAEHTNASIYAMDLWIPADENFKRFSECGFENRIIPIHADTNDTTFADEYFDAVFSIDCYHYFGRDEAYLDKHLAPLVKKGGKIAICIPGFKKEYEVLPEEILYSWSAEDMETIHSIDWWKLIIQKSKLTEMTSISEMDCFEESWNDWLACDNPYAVSDRASMEAGAGKYMNLIKIVCKRI
ncbi:MAG: methyltransferase domain-containing protein [Oscillospiraceae bacterium]|nr:methyltransferase domain-containing protein [Oscillospiraceae bacterium]